MSRLIAVAVVGTRWAVAARPAPGAHRRRARRRG
jgi:hypothetical protein